MAIRNRRGVYSDFDKTKMVDGEFAVVKSGDPVGSGKAVYMSFQSGTADRLALFDDLEEYGGKIDAITVNGGEELPIVDKTVDIPIPTVDISAPAGEVVEFSTGGDNMPMKAVEVSMSPIQDLNGYSSPWPASGGKNLFDISTATVGRYINENGHAQSTTTTDWSVSDFIPVQASTTYTFTPNSTAGGSAKHGFYDSNKNFISVIASGPQTFTTPSNCAYVRVSFRTVSENVQLEKGSTATAWEPYSNICPISGRTGASVVRAGKNLFTAVVGQYVDSSGVPAASSTSNWCSESRINIGDEKNITLTLYDKSTYTAGSVGYVAWDAEGTFIRSGNFMSTNNITTLPASVTVALPSDTAYIYLRGYHGGGATGINTAKVQLEFGTTATDYEERSTTVYPITFTSAGTVYAGTVDLVSGRLEVTHGGYTFTGDETFGMNGGNTNIIYFNGNSLDRPMKSGTWNDDENTLCSSFEKVMSNADFGIRFGANSKYIYFYQILNTLGIASIADWKTWLASNNVQITYPLAMPLTYNLTPVQVMSLLGENVVWSPDGTISNLKYSADISLVIADLYSKLSS